MGAVLLGAVIALLSGCASEEKEEPVEITLMHGWGGTLSTHAVMQSIYDDFSKENPDIRLTCLPSSDSTLAVEAANDLLAVDKMPDIVSTNGLTYYERNAVKRGMALDLLPYIKGDKEFREEIHPSVLELWEEEGALYTVPDALEVMGYWYNAEYFKRAGVTDASGQVKTPDTWEEFFDACEKVDLWMKKEKPKASVLALDAEQVVEGFFLARVAGCGEEGLEMTVKDPENYTGEAVKRAVADAGILYQYSNNVNSLENARQAFLEGNSAVYINGVWESQVLEDSSISDQIRYANYPTESGESLSYVSPSSGYVIAKSDDPKKEEACVRFLKYMLSKNVQMKIAVETGQAPENPGIDKVEITKSLPMLGNALEKAHDADIQIYAMSSLWKSSVVEELKNNIYQATQSQSSYEDLFEKLASK